MRLLPLLVAIVVLLAGCGSDDSADAPPSGDADYSGIVIDVSDGRALVRADGDACGIWVAPADDVEVFTATMDGGERGSWLDVVQGQSVDLWIPGPIAESCPMQGTAQAVVIG